MLKEAKNIFIIAIIAIIVIIIVCRVSITVETSNSMRLIPIYSVDKNEKIISISFDAAWGAEHTKKILDVLDEYDIKTTFFLVGFWIDKYPDMVAEIDKRGHEIGSHSENHFHMNSLTSQKITNELETVEKKLELITEKKPKVFRPPFGEYNNNLIETCKSLNYHVIQWDVDSLDWKDIPTNQIVNRVIKNVKPGSIVLFHNNAERVEEYLPLILKDLTKRGYKIVPISELIYNDNYYIDHTGKQYKKNQ